MFLAGAAAAEDRSPVIEYLEGQGCTVGPQSKAAAESAGLGGAALEAEAARALAAGQAVQTGDYVVLDADICTIRLPRIESRWSAVDPDVQAMAPFIREEYSIGDRTYLDEGCFLREPSAAFVALNEGDAEAGFADYIAFMGAGIIAGDVRFYANSPLGVPPGPLLTRGDCAETEEMPAIEASHRFIEEGFELYVRTSFETLDCRDTTSFEAGMAMLALQGIDTDKLTDEQGPANAQLWLEMLLITMAAGWFEGQSATEKGSPRPPLCTYGQ